MSSRQQPLPATGCEASCATPLLVTALALVNRVEEAEKILSWADEQDFGRNLYERVLPACRRLFVVLLWQGRRR
jgi:hypothetical protein